MSCNKRVTARIKGTVLPRLTAAQRQAALDKALQARRSRAAMLAQLSARELTLAQVLAQDGDPVVGQTRVTRLVQALPGIGTASGAPALLKQLGISASKRVQGLTAGQRQRLLTLQDPGTGRSAWGATVPPAQWTTTTAAHYYLTTLATASPETLRSYDKWLARVIRHLGAGRLMANVSEQDLENAVDDLWAASAPATSRNRRYAARGWYDWAAAQLDGAPADLESQPSRRPPARAPRLSTLGPPPDPGMPLAVLDVAGTVHRFVAALKARGVSGTTVTGHRKRLTRLAGHLGPGRPVADIDRPEVEAAVITLWGTSAPSTLNTNRSSARAWFRWYTRYSRSKVKIARVDGEASQATDTAAS